MQNFYLLLRNGLLKIIILHVIFLWDKKLSPMIRGKSLTVMSLLFWLIVFFRKKVPAKGLDPASQALLNITKEIWVIKSIAMIYLLLVFHFIMYEYHFGLAILKNMYNVLTTYILITYHTDFSVIFLFFRK